MISRSRAGRRARRARRAASGALHADMFGPRNLSNGVDELPPVVALRGEDLPPFGGEPVEAAAALARLLDPLAGDPAALLQAVEEGIQRCHLELQAAAGSLLDQLADLVTVPRTRLDQRQNQQLGAALLQLPIEHPRYMLHSDILYRGTGRAVSTGRSAAGRARRGRNSRECALPPERA